MYVNVKEEKDMIHAHITAWFLGIILFFIAVSTVKKDNKIVKIKPE